MHLKKSYWNQPLILFLQKRRKNKLTNLRTSVSNSSLNQFHLGVHFPFAARPINKGQSITKHGSHVFSTDSLRHCHTQQSCCGSYGVRTWNARSNSTCQTALFRCLGKLISAEDWGGRGDGLADCWNKSNTPPLFTVNFKVLDPKGINFNTGLPSLDLLSNTEVHVCKVF